MHSILLKIGPFAVHSYGFMVVLAFMAGALWLIRAGRKDGVRPEMAFDLILYIMVAAAVMSRVVFVLLQKGSYFADPISIFKVWEGGLSFHGGVIGGLAAAAWYTRKHHLPFWRLADDVAPSLGLGYAIARIGCFLNGCCYGIPTDLPWACRFEDPPMSGHLILPSHPVQLYASLINLGIFALLIVLWNRKRYDGQTFCQYLVLYAIYRFIIESLRKGVTAQVLAFDLTEAQWTSILMLVGIPFLMHYLQEKSGLLPQQQDTQRPTTTKDKTSH